MLKGSNGIHNDCQINIFNMCDNIVQSFKKICIETRGVGGHLESRWRGGGGHILLFMVNILLVSDFSVFKKTMLS
jgi:hypothetical protein